MDGMEPSFFLVASAFLDSSDLLECSSSSSRSSCSPDSSDLAEEDDCGYVEEASDRDAAADFTSRDDIDHTQPHSNEQYAAACDNIAEEMRKEVAAETPKLFVTTENCFYVKLALDVFTEDVALQRHGTEELSITMEELSAMRPPLIVRKSGYNLSGSPKNTDKKWNPPRCSICGISGHRSNTCFTREPALAEY